MTDKFYEYFLTDRFDNKVILKSAKREYTVKDVKNMFGKEIENNENLKDIIDFLNKTVNSSNDVIEFKTSGSTANESKCIKKSVKNMLLETHDMYEELGLAENMEFISTTTLKHIFGMCFHFILPLNTGSVINIDRINYPEDIKIENAVLITSPSFLDSLMKYDEKVEVKPKIIISAGSKLKDETYKYALKIANRVIDLYGSTETNSIGWRENPEDKRIKLFRGVKIFSTGDSGTKLSTAYAYEPVQEIGDRIKVFGNEIELLGRCDRILKVQEKRILADNIESEIRKCDLINDVFCLDTGGKIGAFTVLTQKGQNFVLENGTLNLIKLLKHNLNDKFEVIPQRWKFFDEIPKNQRGKVDIDKIKTIFNLNLTLPLVLSRTCEKDAAEFELCFLKNSNFFKGHFEGMPILAGVVQFFYADFFIKEAFNIECRQGQIRRVKFSNIIKPDKIIKLKLTKTETGVSFRYEDTERTYSSGIFPLKNYL